MAAETKICPVCAETIKAAAKKCPRCGSVLFSERRRLIGWAKLGITYSLFICPFLLGSWWMRDVKSPGLDFAQYRDKIIISDTTTHFARGLGTNMMSVVGYMRNDSGHSWKDLQLEVQYFDSTGKLVDTKTAMLSHQELPAGMTEAFRIRDAAGAEESAYASHKVLVRKATDARKVWITSD